jgi:hypothetical protein
LREIHRGGKEGEEKDRDLVHDLVRGAVREEDEEGAGPPVMSGVVVGEEADHGTETDPHLLSIVDDITERTTGPVNQLSPMSTAVG